MKRPPVRGPSASTAKPWLAVVADVRRIAEGEYWRAAAVDGLRGWEPFAVAWRGVAPALQSGRAMRCAMRAPDRGSMDDQIAWTWDVVEPEIDHVLRVIDQRVPLPSLAVAECFEVMRGAALIFADGSVSSIVISRVDLAQISVANAAAARANKSGAAALRSKRDLDLESKGGKP